MKLSTPLALSDEDADALEAYNTAQARAEAAHAPVFFFTLPKRTFAAKRSAVAFLRTLDPRVVVYATPTPLDMIGFRMDQTTHVRSVRKDAALFSAAFVVLVVCWSTDSSGKAAAIYATVVFCVALAAQLAFAMFTFA